MEETKIVVPGLLCIPPFISAKQAEELIQSIDQEDWLDLSKRRVQHHGYKYEYQKRSTDESMKAGNLPNWADNTAQKTLQNKYLKQSPDPPIIHEYQLGQGIAPHVDCETCFTDEIASLSLGSPCLMDFTNKREPKQSIALKLSPLSLWLMKGAAPYERTHGIRARKSDIIQRTRVPRKRRISLTFRKVLIKNA